jgi:signal recognition particle subunit SRP54
MAFSSLTERFKHIFSKLTGAGRLTDLEIKAAMREIKLALLEADVNFNVVKEFVRETSEKCSGEAVMKSLTPGQQVIKIVNEEMVKILGEKAEKLGVSSKPPTVIMMVGLQGAGKTTFCGKLGMFLKGQGKKVLLVGCDIYRPAAGEQLKIVAKGAGVEFFGGGKSDVIKIARDGIKHAISNSLDTVIVDTAGRLHIDEELMKELVVLKGEIKPTEILLTVDAMFGQDAVNMAKQFDERLDLTGILLTKLDGDTRGGAALSIRKVIGKPIKFAGTGERLGDLETFHPDRMAGRILGMGDVLTVIEKARGAVNEAEVKRMQDRLKRKAFTLDDFLIQFDTIKRMGNIDEILENLGGMMGGGIKFGKMDANALKRNKAIIQSMTHFERANPDEIKGSRKRRIASGSGTSIQEINILLKQFEQSKVMMTNMAGNHNFKQKAMMRQLGGRKMI